MTEVAGKGQGERRVAASGGAASGGRVRRSSGGAAARSGVVAEIAERRRADVGRELGSKTYGALADEAAGYSARPGNAPRPIVERLAAPGLHLIAEVKRRSPSAGPIAADADPVALARAYEAGGASAISVLCEPHWFGGSLVDLRAVRAAVTLPVVAKEFVVDERQLPVLRSAGADMVLLLASLLPPGKLARFAGLARELGLEPLVEVHDERELDAALATHARVIGLNNRNLRTLRVDPELCLRLRPLVPNDRLVVGESGVGEPRTLVGWRAVGIDAALIGEALMRSAEPASAARAFVAAGSVPHDVAAVARQPLVKICGVTDEEGVLAALRAGADAIGLNLVPGTPRALSLAEATYLAALAREASPARIRPRIVAVFADAPAREIEAAVAAFGPDAVQLSGNEPASTIASIRRPVWKVLHLPAAHGEPAARADGASQTAAGAAAGLADAGSAAANAVEAGKVFLAAGTDRLILDTAGGPFPGGTGRQIARRIAALVAREIPIILAGGLDAANVADAVLDVPAVGVDVASGVEIRPSAASSGAASARTQVGATVGPRPRKDPFRVALFAKRARAARFDRPHVRPRPTPVSEALLEPDAAGRWGLNRDFGGRYVPETLVAALDQLEAAWSEVRHDPRFWAELREMQFRYGGRPTPIYRADRLGGEVLETARRRAGETAGSSEDLLPDRIRLYLKREDLNHTGAHKLNNALGQVLLARRLGKRRVIAETGAGMHGVATATACALLDIPCVVHMGIEDIRRQAPNVLRMEALGAEVRPVLGGSGTLKDAVSEALRDWVTNVKTSHYCLGSTMGPHPYPMLVRDFQRVIGDEAAAQLFEVEGRLPDLAIACVGGGSNALGLLNRFIGEPSVRLAVAEAAGEGIESGRHAAALLAGTPGILHGSRSYMLQDADGQVIEAVSISAGLDYPGIGPQLAALMEARRLLVAAATDSEALAAVRQVARTEGILAALESAHAVAALPEVLVRLAAEGVSGALDADRQSVAGASHRPLPREAVIVLGLSGRGDKDLAALGLKEVGR
ncbi:MAG TPA: tryptophan synthase subunit beta [Candidatus Limnocylindrales bacterium]|jgi:tryptophan synthase beta chain